MFLTEMIGWLTRRSPSGRIVGHHPRRQEAQSTKNPAWMASRASGRGEGTGRHSPVAHLLARIHGRSGCARGPHRRAG